MKNMTIECGTHDDFMQCVYDCVRKGLTFRADHAAYIIYLSGGY